MQMSTVVMMVVVLGILWGGFAGLLIYSAKAEKRRTAGSASDEVDNV